MAGSKDKCPQCDDCFYGKQKNLKCKKCRKRYHYQCLKITLDEYQIYLEASNFQCNNCLNNRSVIKDDTPIKQLGNNSGDEVEICNTFGSTSADDLDVKNKRKSCEELSNTSLNYIQRSIQALIEEGVFEIVRVLQTELTEVKGELKHLREVNDVLSNTIMKIDQDLLSMKISGFSQPSFPPVTTEDGLLPFPLTTPKPSVNVSKNKNKKTKHKKPELHPDNSNGHQSSYHKSSNVPASPCPSNPNPTPIIELSPPVAFKSSDNDAASSCIVADDSSWIQARNRKNKNKWVEPSNSKDNLNPVKRWRAKKFDLGQADTNTDLVRSKTKALFVSRFNSSVTESNITGLLQNCEFKYLKCSRLKTKHSHYNSFFIEVNAVDFERLNDPKIWPSGTLLAPFYGPLRKEALYIDNPTEEDKTQTVNG